MENGDVGVHDVLAVQTTARAVPEGAAMLLVLAVLVGVRYEAVRCV